MGGVSLSFLYLVQRKSKSTSTKRTKFGTKRTKRTKICTKRTKIRKNLVQYKIAVFHFMLYVDANNLLPNAATNKLFIYVLCYLQFRESITVLLQSLVQYFIFEFHDSLPYEIVQLLPDEPWNEMKLFRWTSFRMNLVLKTLSLYFIVIYHSLPLITLYCATKTLRTCPRQEVQQSWVHMNLVWIHSHFP